jgi:hypothetical protein
MALFDHVIESVKIGLRKPDPRIYWMMVQELGADPKHCAGKAAHEIHNPRAALAYAIQFEGVVRQWDVKGQWLPMSDRTPSAIHYKGKKWIGPT